VLVSAVPYLTRMMRESICAVCSSRFMNEIKVKLHMFTHIASNLSCNMLRGVVIIEVVVICINFDKERRRLKDMFPV
jgi:hypothetical protein